MKNKFVGGLLLLLSAILLAAACGCNEPKKLESMPQAQRSAKALAEGETAWMNWWSLHADRTGDCYIKEGEEVFSSKPGPDAIKVTKRGDGFAVDLAGSQHHWDRADYYLSTGQKDASPVLEWTNTK